MKAAWHGLLSLVLAGLTTAVAAQAPQTCPEAWDAYKDFQKNNKMAPGQHAVTVYGANVRALCGADALPVPPGTDTPRAIVRKPPPKPPRPPDKPVVPRP